jgi:hypothetical protein
VHQQRRLVRRRRAFERDTEDGDQEVAAGERRQPPAQPLRAGHRVELEAVVDEAGRAGRVVVGAESDDEDVGVVAARVGGDVARSRVDRRDPFPAELDARQGDVAVGEPDLVGGMPTEEHVQLREAEDEPVVLVDQRDANGARCRLRQPGGELESAEPGTKDHDMFGHDLNVGGERVPARAVVKGRRRDHERLAFDQAHDAR